MPRQHSHQWQRIGHLSHTGRIGQSRTIDSQSCGC
jgi:hypothetical protein